MFRSSKKLTKMFHRFAEWFTAADKPSKKPATFANEREAFDFCRRVHKETKESTVELGDVYAFYLNSLNEPTVESTKHVASGSGNCPALRNENVVKVYVRRATGRSLGAKKRVEATL